MAAAAPGPESPRLIAETEDFAVVYKPPRIHCVPLKPGEGETLLAWYARIFPPVMAVSGKKPGEGGLLHRLDYETQGLVLVGKNQSALDSLWAQQEAGRFIKEYGAVTVGGNFRPLPPGFPPLPEGPPFPANRPFRISSFFRPYGPGRKAVRPVCGFRPGKEIAGDRGRPYETEVIETAELGQGRRYFALRIIRGFRHQIRCHLAWIGSPIAGDPLYGGGGAADGGETGAPAGTVSPEETPPPLSGEGCLALRAQALYFCDPRTGAPREFRIPAIREQWDAAAGIGDFETGSPGTINA